MFLTSSNRVLLRRNDRSICANLDRLFESLEISSSSVYPRCSAARVTSSPYLESFYLAYDLCKPLNPCKTASQPEHFASRNDLRFRARRSIYSDESDEMKKVRFREQRSMRAISRRFRRMNEDNIQRSNNRRIESTSSLFTRTRRMSHEA